MLKELGRAAFENPIRSFKRLKIENLKGLAALAGMVDEDVEDLANSIQNDYQIEFGNHHRKRAVRIAQLEADQDFSEVLKCPVCGVDSLVVYEETDYDYPMDDKDGPITWRYTHNVTCENCTFHLWNGEVKNASEYSLTEIDDYWKTIDLSSSDKTPA